jgi:hypothetical protein
MSCPCTCVWTGSGAHPPSHRDARTRPWPLRPRRLQGRATSTAKPSHPPMACRAWCWTPLSSARTSSAARCANARAPARFGGAREARRPAPRSFGSPTLPRHQLCLRPPSARPRCATSAPTATCCGTARRPGSCCSTPSTRERGAGAQWRAAGGPAAAGRPAARRGARRPRTPTLPLARPGAVACVRGAQAPLRAPVCQRHLRGGVRHRPGPGGRRLGGSLRLRRVRARMCV